MALFSLLCQEQDPFSEQEEEEQQQLTTTNEPFSDEFIASLVSSEHKPPFPKLSQTYLRSARRQAVQWALSTCSCLGFGAATALLAASYLDRCFLSPGGLSLRRRDSRWMAQLSAVACLSLAAKVEESGRVPFLVDLQTSGSRLSSDYLFEPKTVKRMELLVLSTLQWRMNPATALSFVQCFVSRKIDSAPRRDDDDDDHHHPLEALKACEAILLSVVADWRWVRFPPSVWASAALLHANVGVSDELQHFMDMLDIAKERVEECHELVVEIMGSFGGGANKRKSCCRSDEPPPSPNGVISGSCFSCESSSSVDSLPMWPPSVSSSPEPQPAKKPHLE